MGLVIDPKQYIIGAAEVYYRAIASVGAWTSIGATVDDIVFRVNQAAINPSEEFNGLLEPIREMDYLSKAGAEAEFSMPELAGSKLQLAILGAGSATLATTDAAGGGSTTLAAAAAVRATTGKGLLFTEYLPGGSVQLN